MTVWEDAPLPKLPDLSLRASSCARAAPAAYEQLADEIALRSPRRRRARAGQPPSPDPDRARSALSGAAPPCAMLTRARGGALMPAAEPAVRNIPSLRAPYAPADEAIAAGLLATRRAAADGRSAHRRPRHAPGRGDPRPLRRPRRHRGLPARLFALDQGGPGADGAGRGAAARARRRHRRPPDRGQARGRRLVASRGALERVPGLGLGLDARHHGARHPAGRDAGGHRRQRWSSGSACRRCAPRRGRRCGCSARISCSGRPSRRRSARAGTHREFRYSFDMLGEGARTAADAERYFDAYARRHRRRSASAPATRALPERPGISVKLSALHPRYEAVSRERVLRGT